MTRPMPPNDLAITGEFRSADDLGEWISETFIDPSGNLANEEHAHLQHAEIGALWTNVPNGRQMRIILATAEQPIFRGGKWQKARHDQQIAEWFGDIPDFILTFNSDWAHQASDTEFCAVVEHELYHCGQQKDIFGAPKFTQDGRPSFGMRGHDVEEFIGVVRRYGAVDRSVREMVDAAKQRPLISGLEISRSCGVCLSAAA